MYRKLKYPRAQVRGTYSRWRCQRRKYLERVSVRNIIVRLWFVLSVDLSLVWRLTIWTENIINCYATLSLFSTLIGRGPQMFCSYWSYVLKNQLKLPKAPKHFLPFARGQTSHRFHVNTTNRVFFSKTNIVFDARKPQLWQGWVNRGKSGSSTN